MTEECVCVDGPTCQGSWLARAVVTLLVLLALPALLLLAGVTWLCTRGGEGAA
jgi:hypothetical protein